MAHPAPPAGLAGTAFRALRLLGAGLGMAALAWGGVQAWRAQPAVGVAPQVAKAVAAAPEPVEESAFRILRGRFREPASAAFRDVRVYSFGPPHERAVCGRVLAGRETPPGGADFVVRVILPGSGRTGGAPLPVIEEGPNLPRATANARGRYCRNADDPRTPQLPPGAAAAAAAAPSDVQAAGGTAPGVPIQGGGGMPAVLRRAVVGAGTAANLRSGPGGGAAVIGTLPRGQVLDVFERAPGGWLRVGVGEPWGWAHASLLVEGP
jgi:SH3 domain-containing protein